MGYPQTVKTRCIFAYLRFVHKSVVRDSTVLVHLWISVEIVFVQSQHVHGYNTS